MLSSLVQSPNQYLKINNSVIDNLKSNEINDKKDFVNESENIAEKNLVSPIQNVNLQTSNNTTSNSKNTPNKNFDYIHYCHKCGSQKLHDEGGFGEVFSAEWLKSHLMSNDQVVGRFNILRTYGMTRDPETKVYMIVMTLADDGDLSAYMKNHFSTLTFVKRLDILYDMATGLCQIHRSGLMHRDLHSGSVMCQRLRGRDPGRDEEYRFVIGDLGQATPPIKVNDNKVFGLDDIPITQTDESSILHSVNFEDIKKEKASKSSYQQICSTNDDIVKENAAYGFSQQSIQSAKFDCED
ncbi:serine/threonine protein kinase [Gigaspora margarita]|uniref:Serine/threonine protein kinase n=1 Tax=Gigaspora margarita TaxID=4874 RepID=A0A8H4AFJ4_GIGMA|nr:serine/threonine protein kinase [Gigaspora margarita]